MRTIILGLLLSLAIAGTARAQSGEVFKIETKGTEYCGNGNSTGFSANDNIDLWVQLVSDTELLVSLTPNFVPDNTTFSMFGYTYLTRSTSASFVGGAQFVNNGFATIQGAAKFDKRTGAVASLKGAFIQSDIFGDGCFSSGTFTSQRIL